MPIHDQFLVATQSFVLRRTPRLHLNPQEEFCGQFSAENTGVVTVKNATRLSLTQEQASPHFPFLWVVPWMPRAKDPDSLQVYIFLPPMTPIWILLDVQSYTLSQKTLKYW